jgi:ribosome-binding factor A
VVQQTIAELLTREMKDPRLGFVSVMDVRMSADLKYANVYVSLFGDERERKASLASLRHSSGWFRTEVGRRASLRFAPEIRFFEDETLDRVFHLEEVLKELKEDEQGGDADD